MRHLRSQRAPLLEVRPSPFSNEGALSHKPKEEASFSVTSPPGGRLQHVDSKGPVFQDTLEKGKWPRAGRVKRREGDNALRRVLENVADGIEQNARAAAEQEQLMAEALAYLDGYEYEFPDGPARGPVAAQWLVDGWRSTITTT